MDSVFSMKNVADVIDNPKVPEPKSSLPLSSLKPGSYYCHLLGSADESIL